MKDKYFIIGGGILQKKFVEKIKNLGFETHVFDYNPDCVCSKLADVFHCISIMQRDTILDIAKKLKPIAVQTVATEKGNITSCYVGNKLGLNCNSYNTSINTHDKSLMKKIFSNNKIKSAAYTQVDEIKNINMDKIKFPAVVKASDSSAGRGISMVKNKKELIEAYKESLTKTSNGIVIIEEYVEGKQFSVETISYNGKHQIVAITEEFTSGPPFFLEVEHLVPARLSKKMFQKIKNFSFNVLNCFDILYGASHIEIKVLNDDIFIIEIASRMGGLRDELIEISTGIDYLELIVNASIGKEVFFKPKKKSYALAKFVYSKSDLSMYKEFLDKKSSPIRKTEVSKNFDEKVEAKSLMDAQGFYYLELSDIKLINNYLYKNN